MNTNYLTSSGKILYMYSVCMYVYGEREKEAIEGKWGQN